MKKFQLFEIPTIGNSNHWIWRRYQLCEHSTHYELSNKRNTGQFQVIILSISRRGVLKRSYQLWGNQQNKSFLCCNLPHRKLQFYSWQQILKLNARCLYCVLTLAPSDHTLKLNVISHQKKFFLYWVPDLRVALPFLTADVVDSVFASHVRDFLAADIDSSLLPNCKDPSFLVFKWFI